MLGFARLILSLVLGVAPATGAAAAEVGSAPGRADERPNVVYMMADDMGFSDVGAFGATRIQTPHLDRLVRDGLRLTEFRNNGKCSPTRASLLSGLYWQETYRRTKEGDLSFDVQDRMAREGHVTVAEVLSDAGYHTMWVGKWHLAGTPSERGFDRTFGFLNGAINFFTGEGTGGQTENWRLDGEIWEVPETGFYATDAMSDRAVEFVDRAARREQPFFLYLAYNAPHYPLQAPEGLVEEYRGIGRLVDRLDAHGELGNTLIVFLSDNGGCLFVKTRTPSVPPGPAHSFHNYETAWANVSNTPFRGYERQAFEGRADGVDGRTTFWEYGRHAAVVQGDWKLVARRGQPWGLYDLESDRTETEDLSGERPDLREELLGAYGRWAERVGARYPHDRPIPSSRTQTEAP